jgi:hypothetical protein
MSFVNARLVERAHGTELLPARIDAAPATAGWPAAAVAASRDFGAVAGAVADMGWLIVEGRWGANTVGAVHGGIRQVVYGVTMFERAFDMDVLQSGGRSIPNLALHREVV